MATESRSLVFQVYRGANLIKTAELSEESVTIGSGGNALLSVDDAALADLHAVINVEENGTINLFDLGSATGTKVNGEGISNVPLKDGDTIDIGSIRIVVTVKAGRRLTGGDDFEDEEATTVSTSPVNASSGPAKLDDDNTDPRQAQSPQITASSSPAAAFTPDADLSAGTTSQPGSNASYQTHEHLVDDEEEEDDGHGGPEEPPEDVIAVLMRSAASDPQAKGKSKIIEVSQIWGDALLATKRFPGAANVSIGGSGSTFFAPGLTLPKGAANYALVRNNAVVVPNEWDGFADVGENRYTFAELVEQGGARREADGIVIPMTDDTRVAVDADGMVFFAQMVHPGRAAPFSPLGLLLALDFLFVSIAGFIFFLGSIFLFLMWFLPPPPANGAFEIPDRLVELMMQKPEPEKKKGANPDAGEGAKAKKEEGKVGKKEAKMDKAKGNKVEMEKQEIDKKVVENAGIMGAMNDSDLAQTLGQSGLSADIQGGIGGLIGAKGTQIGSGGLGARGGGLGGGGTAEGLGGLGTKGIGGGLSGFGKGGGNFGKKGEGGIGTVGGDPIILGALDRSLIDEVIKRHMNQIRYCYQRELTKNNTLAGKIVIKFTIAKDGSVSSAQTKSSSMSNNAVEGCIEGRFMKMQFPQPKGGGIVIVSYPFLFSPG